MRAVMRQENGCTKGCRFSDFKWDRSGKFQYDPVVRERLRNEYDLEDKLVIGHVGRFCEEKNHKKILEIAKELQKGIRR